MKNYLFFRTDRIGDFLVSAILIKSIKRNDKESHITLVASQKNYYYISKLDFVDKVYLYPNNFFKKIILFFQLFKKKYYLICALDGKKRSIYFSIFLNSNKKILMTTKKFFKEIFKFFFTKIFNFNESIDKLTEIKDVLNICEMSFDKNDQKFLKNQKINSKIKLISDYLIFHFDEKWIDGSYISKYKSIQPEQYELDLFINNLINKTNLNLIITTGFIKNKILSEYLINFNKINHKLYEKKIINKIIQVYVDIDFFELEYLIRNSNQIITCHGAPTHLASALGKKVFDIYDKSEKNFYYKWVNHIENYNFFYRESFKELTNKILHKI